MNIKFLSIIFVIFIIFTCIQIYFYMNKYNENQLKMTNINNFENRLMNIDNDITKKEYILDDKTLEQLLEHYNNLDK